MASAQIVSSVPWQTIKRPLPRSKRVSRKPNLSAYSGDQARSAKAHSCAAAPVRPTRTPSIVSTGSVNISTASGAASASSMSSFAATEKVKSFSRAGRAQSPRPLPILAMARAKGPSPVPGRSRMTRRQPCYKQLPLSSGTSWTISAPLSRHYRCVHPLALDREHLTLTMVVVGVHIHPPTSPRGLRSAPSPPRRQHFSPASRLRGNRGQHRARPLHL